MLDIFGIDVVTVISPVSRIDFAKIHTVVKLSYRLLYYFVGCLVW